MGFKKSLIVTILFFSNSIMAQDDLLSPERQQALMVFLKPRILIDKGEKSNLNTKDGLVYVTFDIKESDNQEAKVNLLQEIHKDLALDSSLNVEIVYLAQKMGIHIYDRKPGDKIQDVLSQTGGCDILNSLVCQDFHVLQNFRRFELKNNWDVLSLFNNTPISDKKRWNLGTLELQMTLKIESKKINYTKKTEIVQTEFCDGTKDVNTFTVALPKVLKETLSKYQKYHLFGLALSDDCEENIINIVDSL